MFKKRDSFFLFGGIIIFLVVFFSLKGISEENIDSQSKATSLVTLREAMFYKKLDNRNLQCGLCFRSCLIPPGKKGFCRVRENREGKLYSLVYSLPSAVHIDPVEKEPQYHFLPGTNILCIGTAGCNFHCKFCQNWSLSQGDPSVMEKTYLPPRKIIELALRYQIPTISFTYNDPIVCFEYLYDTARLARVRGLRILWHSNTTLKEEPLRELLKFSDAVTVDLKGFSEEFYLKTSRGSLKDVLRNLKIIKKEGVWLEIVNLIIPTLNDDPEDIRRMCVWIRENLGNDVPLHFTRFFPAYQLKNLPPTPVRTLEEAVRIAREEGLLYVFIGNVPGHTYNSTFCPSCKKIVIKRIHFQVKEKNIRLNFQGIGQCKFCGYKIKGVFK